MLNDPTTISSVARLIGETLQADYGIDAEPLYRESRIDRDKFEKPGSRVPFSKMSVLWQLATEASGDAGFGLRVGSRVTPADFYVLGHAWLASETLLGAFRRLARFMQVLSTASSSLEVRLERDSCTLIETFANRVVQPHPSAMDAGFVALTRMCDFVTAAPVRPWRVVLPEGIDGRGINHSAALGCPVEFGDIEIWEFPKADVEARLSGSIPEVADAVEVIASEYLASLDEGAVAREVREMLIQMMPAGRSDQESVAKRLYRSRSTLQRQLVAEGTSYRQILESTRQSLAENYLRSNDYSQAEVAFMLGFTDQSNFARAFRRWTGMTPGEFRKSI
jgi:AraC-like DNA-binding protein